MSLPTKHYPFLDFFRGISVLWVIMHHVFIFFNMRDFLGPMYPFLNQIAQSGLLGVDMFFVISGFLITGIIVRDNEGIRIARFYVRRFLKIMPQYLAVLIVGVLFNTFVSNFVSAEDLKWLYRPDVPVVYYFLFLQSYIGQIPILAHTWSLTIEEHFYLFYPWLLFLVWRFKREPADRLRWAGLLCLVFIVLGNVVRYLSAPTSFDLFAFGSPTSYQTTFIRFDALFMGCLLKFSERAIVRNARPNSLFSSFFCLILSAMIYALLIMAGPRCLYHWLYFTLAYIAPGLLVISCLKGFDLFSQAGVVPWIGKNSYGIYLWHYVVLFPYIILSLLRNELWVVLLYVATTIYVGVLSTRTIEKYFLNLRERVVA